MNESNQVVVWFNPNMSCSSGDIELPYYSTEITTSSSPYAVALAKHLNSIGAKMYLKHSGVLTAQSKKRQALHSSSVCLKAVLLLIYDVHVSFLPSIDVWKRSSKVTELRGATWSVFPKAIRKELRYLRHVQMLGSKDSRHGSQINAQVSKTSGSLLTLFPSHASSCFTSFIVQVLSGEIELAELAEMSGFTLDQANEANLLK